MDHPVPRTGAWQGAAATAGNHSGAAVDGGPSAMTGCSVAPASRPAAARRPGDPRHRPPALRRGARPADHLPARARRPRVAGRRRPVRATRRRCSSPPTTTSPGCCTRTGVPLDDARRRRRRRSTERGPRAAWRLLCEHWAAFRGTPVRFWLESELADIFGVTVRPSADTADAIYDQVAERLRRPRLPAAGAARALRHRGAGHHRRPRRRPRRTRGARATTRPGPAG